MKINYWITSRGKATSWRGEIEADARALNYTYRAIMDKPTTIEVQRRVGGTMTKLAPQTVRIEQTRIQPDRDVGTGGREMVSNATLIGFKGHPDIDDTDLQVGDRFEVDGVKYIVRTIWPATQGFLSAWLEVVE